MRELSSRVNTMFSLSPPTRDRSAAALHMVRDRLLAMPGAPLKPESPLFGALQSTVTSTVPAGTVRNWCMQPIVPADHAWLVCSITFIFCFCVSSLGIILCQIHYRHASIHGVFLEGTTAPFKRMFVVP